MSEQQQPQFGIEKIYLKDLSLEVPSAPQIFLESESPQIEFVGPRRAMLLRNMIIGFGHFFRQQQAILVEASCFA